MNAERRRTLISSGGQIDGSNAQALDVVFSKIDGSELVIISGQENWPDNGYTPVGIVVVPGTHNRYGDGSCGIMSLVGMDYNHPETGIPITDASQSDDVLMLWGMYGTTIDNSTFVSTTALTMATNYIPYQIDNTSTVCFMENGGLVWPYAGTVITPTSAAVIPTSAASTTYSNTGGYVQATTGKSGCDFNGIRNTAAVYAGTYTYSQWTASTVELNYVHNAPAAVCCCRFRTIGTKSFLLVFGGITSNDLSYGTPTSTKDNKGFWYLPAEGELCYLPRYRFEINKTIFALNRKYGNVGVGLSTYYYWSSSLYNTKTAWFVNMYMGIVSNDDRYVDGFVRAFMRL